MALLVEVAEYRNHLIRQRIPSSYFYFIHGSGLAGHTLVPVRSSTSEPWPLQNFTPLSVTCSVVPGVVCGFTLATPSSVIYSRSLFPTILEAAGTHSASGLELMDEVSHNDKSWTP